jgi:hypothetical protein
MVTNNNKILHRKATDYISAISKLKDGDFHVVGEIVVVHEVTLAAAVTNLKRIILACGERRVIIITPGPRYLSPSRAAVTALTAYTSSSRTPG